MSKSKKISEVSLNTFYSLMSSVIAVSILNAIGYLMNLTGNGILKVSENNLELNLLATMMLYYLIPCLVIIFLSIISFCGLFIFNTIKPQVISQARVNQGLWSTLKTIPFIIFIWLLLLVILYIKIMTNGYIGLLVGSCIIGISLYGIKKYEVRTTKRILPHIGVVSAVVILIGMGMYIYLYFYQFHPKIELEKNIYTYQDNSAIIKIVGYHEVKEAKVYRTGGYDLPIRKHSIDDITYLVIDFSSIKAVEGEYCVILNVNNKEIRNNFLYVFNGSFDDKSKYIDKYFIRAKAKTKDTSLDEKNSLEILKQAALTGNKEKFENTLIDLKKTLSPAAISILQEIARDHTFGLSET